MNCPRRFVSWDNNKTRRVVQSVQIVYLARRLGNGKMSGNVSCDFINGIVNVYEPGHKDALEWSFGSTSLYTLTFTTCSSLLYKIELTIYIQ